MSTFSVCTFAAAAGTPLDGYNVAGETRFSRFAGIAGGSASAIISPTGEVRSGGSDGWQYYLASGIPASPDYAVQATFVSGDNPGDGTDGQALIGLRFNRSMGTGYALYYSGYTGTWTLARWDAGSTTALGTYSLPISGGATVTAQIAAVGTTITATINGASSPQITGTDATYAAAGRPALGLNVASSDTRGIHLRAFSASGSAAPGDQASAASGATFAPTHAALAWSPGNVYFDAAGFAHVTKNASYFQTQFSGTSFVALVDVSTYHLHGIAQPHTGAIATGWGQWVVEVDGAILPAVVVPDPGAGVDAVRVTLASGLAPGSHTIKAWFDVEDETDTFSPQDEQVIEQFVLDAGASLTAATLRPHAIMVMGDSITKGFDAQDVTGGSASVNYPPKIFATLLGDALNAETGVVGLSGQGYVHSYNAWTGLLSDTFGFYQAGHARVWPTNLTALFIAEGTNDASQDVTSAAQALIATARAAVGAATWIFICVPINGTHRSELATAVSQYQAAHPSDAKVALLDPSDGTYTLVDGTHPDTASHATLATNLAGSASAYLTPVGHPTPAQVLLGAAFVDSLGVAQVGAYVPPTVVPPTYASAADVRAGVDRGDGTAGTCHVPVAADVRAGVAVDATVGTFAQSVNLYTPVAQDGTLTVVRGFDLMLSEGLQVDRPLPSAPPVPTGAPAQLILRPVLYGAVVTVTGSVVQVGEANVARFEIPAATSKSLALTSSNAGRYEVGITLPNTHEILSLEGSLVVRD